MGESDHTSHKIDSLAKPPEAKPTQEYLDYVVGFVLDLLNSFRGELTPEDRRKFYETVLERFVKDMDYGDKILFYGMIVNKNLEMFRASLEMLKSDPENESLQFTYDKETGAVGSDYEKFLKGQEAIQEAEVYKGLKGVAEEKLEEILSRRDRKPRD
ncbi:MAG: hypothetical protein U0525_05930 [Patescibacteria group bacterium]